MSDQLDKSAQEPVEDTSAEVEHRWHSYVGNAIPWYVRLIWLGFWVLAVYYMIAFLFPAMQVEISSPP